MASRAVRSRSGWSGRCLAFAREDFERLLNALEFRFYLQFAAVVAIRMVLRPQTSIRALYLCRRGSVRQAKSLVVLIEAHALFPSSFAKAPVYQFMFELIIFSGS